MNIETNACEGRELLTEREVLAAARAIRELQVLRSIQGTRTGRQSLSVPGTTIPLEDDEFAACVALLIERHTCVLGSLGIRPDQMSH